MYEDLSGDTLNIINEQDRVAMESGRRPQQTPARERRNSENLQVRACVMDICPCAELLADNSENVAYLFSSSATLQTFQYQQVKDAKERRLFV